MTILDKNIGASNKTYGSGLYHNYHQNIKENINSISDNDKSKKNNQYLRRIKNSFNNCTKNFSLGLLKNRSMNWATWRVSFEAKIYDFSQTDKAETHT